MTLQFSKHKKRHGNRREYKIINHHYHIFIIMYSYLHYEHLIDFHWISSEKSWNSSMFSSKWPFFYIANFSGASRAMPNSSFSELGGLVFHGETTSNLITLVTSIFNSGIFPPFFCGWSDRPDPCLSSVVLRWDSSWHLFSSGIAKSNRREKGNAVHISKTNSLEKRLGDHWNLIC